MPEEWAGCGAMLATPVELVMHRKETHGGQCSSESPHEPGIGAARPRLRPVRKGLPR